MTTLLLRWLSGSLVCSMDRLLDSQTAVFSRSFSATRADSLSSVDLTGDELSSLSTSSAVWLSPWLSLTTEISPLLGLKALSSFPSLSFSALSVSEVVRRGRTSIVPFWS
ncbi:hypothetical protein BKA61DRAFT_599285 [Leptodontidium sp. MPI-SDFR-AT-0119]|nr:hypothetical protein BKA61DRAFT_599285 [Leptodontidium sp. MPI-SDFR-AT-0119]